MPQAAQADVAGASSGLSREEARAWLRAALAYRDPLMFRCRAAGPPLQATEAELLEMGLL